MFPLVEPKHFLGLWRDSTKVGGWVRKKVIGFCDAIYTATRISVHTYFLTRLKSNFACSSVDRLKKKVWGRKRIIVLIHSVHLWQIISRPHRYTHLKIQIVFTTNNTSPSRKEQRFGTLFMHVSSTNKSKIYKYIPLHEPFHGTAMFHGSHWYLADVLCMRNPWGIFHFPWRKSLFFSSLFLYKHCSHLRDKKNFYPIPISFCHLSH